MHLLLYPFLQKKPLKLLYITENDSMFNTRVTYYYLKSK